MILMHLAAIDTRKIETHSRERDESFYHYTIRDRQELWQWSGRARDPIVFFPSSSFSLFLPFSYPDA